MRYTQAQLLRSEISTVERFLAETPEDQLIMRKTWESRLKVLRERLVEAQALPQTHPLSITFRGKPVEGTRSINATFASEAVRAFVEATDTVTASLVTDDLRERGPLPGARDRSLRIVGTATGSFGFELELPPAPPEAPLLFPSKSIDPHVEAITTMLRLLDEAATGDEDAISDLIAEIHPRAAARVREFASVLVKNEALFAVTFLDRQVRFDRDAQVKRVVESLADSDISEDKETFTGTILGVLPESRRFEARLAAGQVVQGKVDRNVPDLAAFKQRWENREVNLTFRVVRVRTRRRYILIGAEASTDHGSQGSVQFDHTED